MLFHRYFTSRWFARSNSLVCVTLSNLQICLVIVTTLLRKEMKDRCRNTQWSPRNSGSEEGWKGLKHSSPWSFRLTNEVTNSQEKGDNVFSEEKTAAERRDGLNQIAQQGTKLGRNRSHWCWLPALLCFRLLAVLQGQKHGKEALTAFPFSSQVTVGTGRPVAVHRNVTTDPKVMFWDSGAFRILANTVRKDKGASWIIM